MNLPCLIVLCVGSRLADPGAGGERKIYGGNMNSKIKKYGYVRVSHRDQNEGRQIDAMKSAGILPEQIYLDKQSGKDFERPKYKELITRLDDHSLVYVKSIDRLGRDYDEVLEQWRKITKEIGADIVVLDMPLLDTRRGKDLMGTFLSDIVLQVLSFVAENERDNIRQRQSEGIRVAKAKGVRFGRPEAKLPDNFEEVYDMWAHGDVTVDMAASSCGMSHSTFYRKATKRKKQNHA